MPISAVTPEPDRLRLHLGPVAADDPAGLQLADPLVHRRGGEAHLAGQLGVRQAGVAAQQLHEAQVDRVHGE